MPYTALLPSIHAQTPNPYPLHPSSQLSADTHNCPLIHPRIHDLLEASYTLPNITKTNPLRLCPSSRNFHYSHPAQIHVLLSSYPLYLALSRKTLVNGPPASSMLPLFVPPLIECTVPTRLKAFLSRFSNPFTSSTKDRITAHTIRPPSREKGCNNCAYVVSSSPNHYMTACACHALPFTDINYIVSVFSFPPMLRIAHLLCAKPLSTSPNHAACHSLLYCSYIGPTRSQRMEKENACIDR